MGLFERIKNLFGSASDPVSEGAGMAELEVMGRPCWIPVTEDGDGIVTTSKFSGIPYLPQGEEWPGCANCGKPMQLFVQLNSDELPEEAEKMWGGGLLQLFYCTNRETNCEVDCVAWEPFSKSTLLRLIAPGSQESIYQDNPVADAFPAKRIVGWTGSNDLPGWEEIRELEIDVSDEMLEELSEKYPVPGEKLLGWPLWVQGVEYPNCRQCGTRMRFVFQIDSEHNIPVMFGDVGIGHITQCPTHLKELAFGWACS